RARLSMVVPPTACPCVVRGVSQATGIIAVGPVTIPGAPTVTPGVDQTVKSARRAVQIRSATLTGSDGVLAWVGGHPHRTLEQTLVNSGDVPLVNSTISLSVGSADDPTGFVAPFNIGRLDVEEKKTFSIPVEFGAISFGKQSVRGVISGTTEPTTFQ